MFIIGFIIALGVFFTIRYLPYIIAFIAVQMSNKD
jgi:hypothetical protein